MAIKYLGTDREFPINPQESLLETLLQNRFAIDHSCEGMASCGTCRIIVDEGLENLPPRNALEQEMANDRGFKANERLSCQLYPCRGLTFKLPNDQ